MKNAVRLNLATLCLAPLLGAMLSLPSWAQTGPFPSGVLTVRRPAVGAVFGQRVRPETVRLRIDNQDFTSLSQIYGDRVTWNPGYDLDGGRHTATVTATTYSGQPYFRVWNFEIRPNSSGNTGNVPYLSLSSQFPRPSQSTGSRPSVGANFGGELSNVSLLVDGQDFTRTARVTSNSISWTPTYDLDPGAHTVRVQATGIHGRQVNTDWTFYVGGSSNNNGSVQLSSRFPESNASVGSQPTLGARFNQSLARVRLFVDGREYTQMASRTDSSILWTPNYELDQGRHTVRVSATGRDGRTVNLEWPFQVVRTGNVSNSTYPSLPYDFGGSSAVSQLTPFPTGSTSARPAVGVHMPASLTVTNLVLTVDGRDFTPFTTTSGSSFYWTPDYDLQKGWHHANFRGTANNQRIEKSWQFLIP